MTVHVANETVSPFHQGEQQVQQRLGVRDKMERFGRQVIRNYMPEQHRDFYAQLPFIFVAHADHEGWPWASVLFNQAGFIRAIDDKHLQLNAMPVAGDSLNDALTIGDRWGLLGIELSTRRRNRLAAHINKVSNEGIELSIDQAFGNCPQYIQQRELYLVDPALMPDEELIQLTAFDQQALELIGTSDTFFVASYVANGSGAVSEGADVSHRGGKPGFIRIDDDKTLTVPDYTGNFHFNTLGNFVENPRAGLLFIDFSKGHILTLTGKVEILWNSPDTAFFAGAERLWTFTLDHGRWLKNGLPLRWDLQDYSPNTRLTGSWSEAAAAKQSERLKNTWQPYQVVDIVQESSLISSFYLQAPEDQKPSFEAGQFLTLKAHIEGKAHIRTYTVSSAPKDDFLRISIKQELAQTDQPAGVFSNFMHEQIKRGDMLQVKPPTGAFKFAIPPERSVLLISAGVGITPMIAMARHALQEGFRTRSMPNILMLCCVRNNEQRAFYTELKAIAEQSSGHIRVVWILSQPEEHLSPGADYDYKGRLSKHLLQGVLVDNDCDAYLCGPNDFMQSQYNSLRELGVENKHIFAEAFGPAALLRDEGIVTTVPVEEEALIHFTESRLEQAWSKGDGTLLEFAEAHGLTPEYGCRSGQCGLCKVTLSKGQVGYQQEVTVDLAADEILLCCAMPAAGTTEPVQLDIQL
ncbi:FAD-binding oxidoreductase [Methyloprofundus sedimenti]|uniref:FAD-binding oxidoreductase n=1 Tax=Methyloprofundus sedimenti TaxID=1420851 RepID=A0A1V8M3L3_9GAMM|nr:pyridoxamine 5'-phosphate oxidase family protein [Methyloprofundus sedimenti]OQK16150.1 FAD-binding oxidoreductase [Methyloprofundus sedimenti]